jgi:hypothetical protein
VAVRPAAEAGAPARKKLQGTKKTPIQGKKTTQPPSSVVSAHGSGPINSTLCGARLGTTRLEHWSSLCSPVFLCIFPAQPKTLENMTGPFGGPLSAGLSPRKHEETC